MEDIQTTAARYDYYAHVLIDPIEVPGTAYVVELAKRTRAVFETPALSVWCQRIEKLAELAPQGANELAEEQRDLAEDRTRLCRGINKEGPLPPYESYYREGASENDTTAIYHAAGVQFDGAVERDDYLGAQAAFLAYLTQAESAARARGDNDSEQMFQYQRKIFECEHFSWVESFCEAALPHARTTYFTSVLKELAAHIV